MIIKELNKEQLNDLVQDYVKFGGGISIEEYCEKCYKRCDICGEIVKVDYGCDFEEVEDYSGTPIKGCEDCIKMVKKDNEVMCNE